MSSPPVHRLSTLATSVLPTPASPSSNSGRFSANARNTAVAKPSSGRYPCKLNACDTSAGLAGLTGGGGGVAFQGKGEALRGGGGAPFPAHLPRARPTPA